MATEEEPDMWEVADAVSLTDFAELEERLDAFNIALTGIDDARLLSIMLRRADGELYAGIYGHTWGGTCQIKLLWIAESERGCSLGTRLLAAAEAEARRRRCHQIMLSTHSFQAPAFYERHGFRPVATIVDNPVGHTDIVMIKQLRHEEGTAEA